MRSDNPCIISNNTPIADNLRLFSFRLFPGLFPLGYLDYAGDNPIILSLDYLSAKSAFLCHFISIDGRGFLGSVWIIGIFESLRLIFQIHKPSLLILVYVVFWFFKQWAELVPKIFCH